MSALTYRADRTVVDASGVPLFRFYADRTALAERHKIAAAPELYEALVKAKSIIQDERDAMVECATSPPDHDIATLDALTKPYVEEYDAALVQINDALAKAAQS